MRKIFTAVAALLSLFLLLSLQNKKLPVQYRETNPREGYDALTFLSAMRAFPNADVAPDAYAIAWQQHKLLQQSEQSSGIRTAWESLGPDNVGGRTTSIAIDPTDTSVVWLGSASGGLWKSTTGGMGTNAWQYISTGFPVLGVSAIAINPNNHNEMFIGTGETYAYQTSTNGIADRTQRGSFGIGILKSLDGGTTWNMSLDWTYQSERGVWDLIFDPTNTSVVYAATTEGVYKTTDDGVSWNNMLNKTMVMDLCMNEDHPDTLLAGVGNEDSPDHGIYRTTDGGTNWTHVTSGLPASTNDGRITISSWANDQNVVMALIANIFTTVGTYKSVDAGSTWTIVNNTDEIVSYQGWYAKGLLINGTNQNKILEGGVDIWRSTDGGGNWSGSNYGVHSDIHEIISSPLEPNKIYVLTDGGLYRSNNFGATNTYFSCLDGYVTSQHYIGSVSTTNPDYILSGLQDNNTYHYNGVPSWYAVIGGDGCYNAINPNDDNTAYGAYQYLNISRSDDGGNNFYGIYYSPSDPNGGNPAAFLAPYMLCNSNTDRMYGGATSLKRSDDGGINWYDVTPDPLDNGNYIMAIGASSTNEDSVYFATAPTNGSAMHVYRSANGGSTYTDISSGLPNRYPRRISVNPNNSKELYVVYSGFNGAQGGHIFHSTNSGNTWTDISTALPDVPFHCLLIDPLATKHLYAGCDFGCYVSVDGGNTWSIFDEGFPDAVMVFDLVESPFDRKVLAFTYGNGVYRQDLLDVTVSALTLQTENGVSIFPNPATDKIFVTGMNAQATLTVFDLDGKEMIMMKSENNSASLNLSSLTPGTYLLRIEENNHGTVKKFVKL